MSEEIVILPVTKTGNPKGSARLIAGSDHVHTETGSCVKNRYDEPCDGLKKMPKLEHPFPGQQLRRVAQWNNYHEINEDVVPITDLEEANIITSETGFMGAHKVLLDIDMPVKILPSSTEGHFHLFIDKMLSKEDYFDLIEAFVKAGIVEDGYLSASAERGYTAVRVPWVPKVIPICIGCSKSPDELDEYVVSAKEEGLRHPSQYVRLNEGTYNPDNGHFYCTPCYIKAGQPLGVAP